MADHRSLMLTARSGDVVLEGTLWMPGPRSVSPIALVTMHPGSGPSDRHNDTFFPPIRDALLSSGIAVASFDKRGVGGSGGSWLQIGIEEQAQDLLAGHAAAARRVPGAIAGVFGHSQGGWVVLEASRTARADESSDARPEFAVMSSGPGVTTAEQERFAAETATAGLWDDVATRARALDAARAVIAMFETGRSADELQAWATEPGNADDADLAGRLYGDDLFDRALWDHLVRLAAFDPVPAMESVNIPLLAVFGSRDTVTPVDPSISALRAHVAPERLRVAVVPGGNHRVQQTGSGVFAPGYPDVVIDFITALA